MEGGGDGRRRRWKEEEVEGEEMEEEKMRVVGSGWVVEVLCGGPSITYIISANKSKTFVSSDLAKYLDRVSSPSGLSSSKIIEGHKGI